MWAMESSEIKNYIFYYKTGKYEEFKHDVNETCEDFCKFLCHQWNFPPLVQLLFGLRIQGKKTWLAGPRQLVAGQQYEFRIRIKIPKIFDLNQLDKNTYDYYYHQVRYDVLHDAIPEIEYPNFKYEILGLCVTDMYLEMIEKNVKIDYLMDNYKNYIPKKLAKRYRDWPYSLILKNKIEKSLNSIQKNKVYDAYYVKSVYLQQIESAAPNYLMEEYRAVAPPQKEDDLKDEKCSVLLQIAPYHTDQPGLRIHYKYKNEWKHVSTMAGFYAIQVESETNQVSFEIQNYPQSSPIYMENTEEVESFISCINLYYRLMVKWNMDLCTSLSTPSLKFLTDLKIHGPIGGKYSYSKIDSKITEKASSVGTFIIRQCEKVFGIYYIDIVTKANQQIETYKINGESNKWKLYDKDGEEKEFDDLVDLAKSIPTENGKYFRLPPSEYDKSPLLLLCQTGAKQMVPTTPIITTSGLRGANPLVLNAIEDLRLYKWEEKNFGDGVFTRMKAEHIQPGRKNTEVTLKILKPTEVATRLADFMKLADKWAKLDLSEIVRMHGITLQNPISLVLESIKFGPLDEFLRSHRYRKHIILLNLVETAYSLAKALHYLQEKQIVHGRIRCSSLEVTHFIPENNDFIVKLGDPGLPYDFTEKDVPWIPIEDYENLNGSRNNMKADIWAYATTLWEIFSRGVTPVVENPIEYFAAGNRLQKPPECNTLHGIYEHIMKSGWEPDSDRRFSPQKIFTLLLDYKTHLSRHYSIPTTSRDNNTKTAPKMNGNVRNGKVRANGSVDTYNHSLMSRETDHTYIGSCPGTSMTTAYIDNSSIGSNGEGSSQISLLNGNSSASSQSTMNIMDEEDFLFHYSEIPGVLAIGDTATNLIFQGKIGSGNFGTVFQGYMEIDNDGDKIEKPVAIKCFRPTESAAQQKDILREARIMKGLKHENIVEIYDYCEHPLLIIMEKMSQSLLSYLPSNQPNLSVENLLHFALDIAKGMEYLEKESIVHRDLAARNVLVNYNNSVDYFNTKCKIADFGLAQFVNKYGYYECSTKRELPLMWYAPETIEHYKFSSKSDVWSYGVTLFEIFSFGESPDLIDNTKPTGEIILNALKEGTRLKCPNFCPQIIYDTLLTPCWSYNSDQRPKFETIMKKIKNLSIANGENV